MYQVSTQAFGPISEYLITNTETGEYLSVIPERGATLNRLRLRNAKGASAEVIDGNPTFEDLMTTGTSMYKGCVLFPFPNRVKDGHYSHDGREFSLPINHPSEGHALHALLATAPFEVMSHEADEFSGHIILRHNYRGTLPYYPFHYALWVEFRLQANGGMVCAMNVQNTGVGSLPCGFGYHPYFRLGESIDSLKLKLPALEAIELDARMIPTGKRHLHTVFHQLQPLVGHQLDNCFSLNERNVLNEVVLRSDAQDLNLHVWQQSGSHHFNYVQVYTPPGRSSIAIEPMTCVPDAVNNGNGLMVLRPGMWAEASWGVRLS